MDWLKNARELLALSQTGLHFADDHYNRERYERIGKIAAELIASGSNATPSEILRWQKAEFGYATPKVDVRGVCFRDDTVLLIRENSDGGRWTLPGGWADVNETAANSVIREIFEESGFHSRVLRLLAVFDRDKQGHTPPHPYHVYKLYFLCDITGGEPTPNEESSEQAFFPVNDLPELSDARVKRHQIERFWEKVRTNDLTTDFD